MLVISDLHAGDSTHDDTLSWRPAELERLVDAILAEVDSVKQGHYDLALFPGDTYHTRRPAPWAHRAIIRLVAGLRERGLQVRIFGGNHDPVGYDVPGPLEMGLFDADELVLTPRVESFGVGTGSCYDVLFLPWFSRANLASYLGYLPSAEQQARTVELVRNVVATRLEACTHVRPVIVATHFTISGATYSTGTQPNLGETAELMLPRNIFPSDRIRLVVSGHVHTPHMLPHIDGFADVLYGGATKLHDFGEGFNTPRVCDIDPYGSEMGVADIIDIPMPATPFVTVGVLDSLPDVAGAVVRFKGEMPAGEQTAAVLASLRQQALDAGALRVAKPSITFIRHDQRVLPNITTTTTPDDALREYAESVGGSYKDDIDELLALQRELQEGGE